MTSAVKIVENISVYTNQDGDLKATAEINSGQVQEIVNQHPEVTDVMVVAIMGPSRKGKSFMMNLFAIYLQHLARRNTERGWLESTQIIKGLTWKKSRSAGTEGIYLWKEAFVLPGSKVKVLLMDCQGCQDKDKVGHASTIDAITNAIGIRTSTVHLYNIVDTKPNINDIQALNNMIYYMEVKEKGRDLIMVHRDWDADDRLGLLRRTPELDNEKAIMERFADTRGNIASYRLPNPGQTIRKASQEDCYTVAELYKEGPEPKGFLDQITELCQCLFRSLDQSRVITSEQFIDAVNNVGQRFGLDFTPLHFAPSAERLKFGIAMKRMNELREKYAKKLDDIDTEGMCAKYELESVLNGIRRNARSEFEQLKSELRVTAEDASLSDELRYGEKSLDKMLASQSELKLVRFKEANEDGSWLNILYNGGEYLSSCWQNWWQNGIGVRFREAIFSWFPGLRFLYNMPEMFGNVLAVVPFVLMVIVMGSYSPFVGLLFILSFAYCLYLAYRQGMRSHNQGNERAAMQPPAQQPRR